MTHKNNRIAVIIPAYNEAQSIAKVVEGVAALRSQSASNASKLIDEIIVCDNASTDDTAVNAQRAGAKVVYEPQAGYGAACLRGIECVANLSDPIDTVVFVDGDHSVDVQDIPKLLTVIDSGIDIVVGSRVPERQQKDALEPHQQMGNMLASWLIRKLWNQHVTDLGPLRAIRYKKLLQLNMQDRRFGWTAEMQIKAIQAGLHYAEIPVHSLKRIGKSKISGTVKGTLGAAHGIFGTIAKSYFGQKQVYQRHHIKERLAVSQRTQYKN